jgi:predicted hotdog family 3-hydroxylacyl-ACP dehydratase
LTNVLTSIPDIDRLLPHEAPMILIDRLIECDDEHAVGEVELREDSLFVYDGKVRASVGIEYMAQTVAAYAGMSAILSGNPISIGYLIAVRQMEISLDHFCVGDLLRIEANHVWGDLKMGSFRVSIKEGLRICLSGTITVYGGKLPHDD